MKKAIFIIFSIVFATVTNAQVQFGIKAGLNFAILQSSGPPLNAILSTKTDFNAGLLASVPIFKSIYLQPELMYSGQGANSQVNSGLVYSSTINMNYLNLPVLFKYEHKTGLFAETGPQISYLLSAKEKIDNISNDFKDRTKTIDFSWAFGIGFKIPDINLGIDLRYNLGLTNTEKADPSGTPGSGTLKNSVFQLDIFYMFHGF
jgi:hypothetical protein